MVIKVWNEYDFKGYFGIVEVQDSFYYKMFSLYLCWLFFNDRVIFYYGWGVFGGLFCIDGYVCLDYRCLLINIIYCLFF